MSDAVIEYHECASDLEVVSRDESGRETLRCRHVGLDGHRCGNLFYQRAYVFPFPQQWVTTRTAIDNYRKAPDDNARTA